MSLPHQIEKLGPPSFKLAGLQVWVHSRQYPTSQEPHDADWLNATVHCGAAGASVWVSGSFLTSWAFARFAKECEVLYASLEGVAVLATDEPDLRATLSANRTGHLSLTVEITPDIVDQQHRFHFSELDQTFLPSVIEQCHALLRAYPTAFKIPAADA